MMQQIIQKKKIDSILILYYSELTFYLMSATLLLIVFTSVHFESFPQLKNITFGRKINQLLEFIGCFILGMVLPIVHAFIKGEKSELDKFLIQAFSVFTNIIICLYSISYVFEANNRWLYLFPAFNFIYACVIPTLSYYDIINVKRALDKDASLSEVFIGSAILLITFYFCHYHYNFDWGLTFSLCVFISSSATNIITNNRFIGVKAA